MDVGGPDDSPRSVPRAEDALFLHFKAPRHAGRPGGATGAGRATNAGCGDRVEVFVREEAGRLIETGFLAKGCAAAIGAASFVCERARGLQRDEALALDPDDLLAAAGGGSPARRHALVLAVDALREALAVPPGAR